MKDSNDIRIALVKERKAKRIKQTVVSKHIGITPASLSRYESGRTEMGLDKVLRYADSLGLKFQLVLK